MRTRVCVAMTVVAYEELSKPSRRPRHPSPTAEHSNHHLYEPASCPRPLPLHALTPADRPLGNNSSESRAPPPPPQPKDFNKEMHGKRISDSKQTELDAVPLDHRQHCTRASQISSDNLDILLLLLLKNLLIVCALLLLLIIIYSMAG